MARRSKRIDKTDELARKRLLAAANALEQHPLFRPLSPRGRLDRQPLGRATWSTVGIDGIVRCDTRLAATDAWMWVIAHQLCHLGMGHLARGRRIERDGMVDRQWNAACCVEVDRFLDHLKIGRPPLLLPQLPAGDAESLWRRWREIAPPESAPGLYGVAEHGDLVAVGGRAALETDRFEKLFAEGLRAAVSAAVSVAAGELETLGGLTRSNTPWQAALDWFVSSYPLLGGVAAGLDLVEDATRCRLGSIQVAAVDAASGEIIVNPHVVLSGPERRFVIAHEILHAALRHDTRLEGRDPWLWNVAADYVINGWLIEMGVGELPSGALHDPQLKGWSADEVHDRLAADLRRLHKLTTFAGVGVCDVLAGEAGRRNVDLDELYRRAIANGLDYHTSAGRGRLPAGLVEEIKALAHPPIGWQVELARWFDGWLPAPERRRTYTRLSRRQSATPDVPRPALVRPEEWERTRTFGVVLDTSGSMDRQLLGKALGAVAAYCAARDVARARVVFCDAAAYDAGWLSPDDIAGRVGVRGRGGTVLQPGVELLERAGDFPPDGPILLITDARCDRLRIRRDHAFLIPHGHRLPFRPKGPVFRMV